MEKERTYLEELGLKFRHEREIQDLSLEKVEKEIGVKKVSIQRFERGANPIGHQSMLDYERLLKIKVEVKITKIEE